MQKRIVRVSPIQAGKVLAVLYGIMSIPVVLIMIVGASFSTKNQGPPVLLMLLIPVLYVVFGFIFTVIGSWLYNVVAGWTGGIEFETVETPGA